MHKLGEAILVMYNDGKLPIKNSDELVGYVAGVRIEFLTSLLIIIDDFRNKQNQAFKENWPVIKIILADIEEALSSEKNDLP